MLTHFYLPRWRIIMINIRKRGNSYQYAFEAAKDDVGSTKVIKAEEHS